MSGPPDVPASELWAKLQELPRPSMQVDFPRLGENGEPIGHLRMWVLTQEEHLICTAAAEKFVREHLKDGKRGEIGYEDMFSNAMAVEIIYRAARDENALERPAFPTPKLIREKLTTEEVGLLFKHYLTVELELGPIASRLTDDEIEAWISRLAEGGSAFPFDSLSSDMQKILVLSMARRLRASPTGTSSAGSPPDASSTASLEERDDDDVDDDDDVPTP